MKKYGFVPISEFIFNKSFYDICATNKCGKYGTNWSCPPGAGTYEELLKSIHRFDTGLVIQTVWTIADSFDIEGMLDSGKKHDKILRPLVKNLRMVIPAPALILSAGACELCETCSYVLKRPCIMPDKAFGSLEAHGVDVTALVTNCGLKYNNGPNTVSYVGVVMFND